MHSSIDQFSSVWSVTTLPVTILSYEIKNEDLMNKIKFTYNQICQEFSDKELASRISWGHILKTLTITILANWLIG